MTVVKIKKQKAQKKCHKKKTYLEVTQFDNKVKNLEKLKLTLIVKKNHKEFIRNNKSIFKTQQRFKSERHNVFTEEVTKIA